MSITNGDFALGDVLPDDFEWRSVVSAVRIARFGSECVESFAWTTLLRQLPADSPRATFDAGTSAVERFAPGWGNASFLRAWPSTAVAAGPPEDFGWAAPLRRTISDIDASPGPVDSFEAGWRNDGFAFAWEDVASAPLPTGMEPFSDFDLMATL